MNTTVWRWFPHGLIAAMGIVFVVNCYMVYDAYSTFPGIPGKTGSISATNTSACWRRRSNKPRSVGSSRRTWRTRIPVLRLTDRAGAPLAATRIDAQAERPVGPVDTTALAFRSIGMAGIRPTPRCIPGNGTSC